MASHPILRKAEHQISSMSLVQFKPRPSWLVFIHRGSISTSIVLLPMAFSVRSTKIIEELLDRSFRAIVLACLLLLLLLWEVYVVGGILWKLVLLLEMSG